MGEGRRCDRPDRRGWAGFGRAWIELVCAAQQDVRGRPLAGFVDAWAEIVCAKSAGRPGVARVRACVRREDACGSGRHGGLSSIG